MKRIMTVFLITIAFTELSYRAQFGEAGNLINMEKVMNAAVIVQNVFQVVLNAII